MSHRKAVAIGAIAVAVLNLAHLFTFAFRFLGPSSSGIFPHLASLILAGRVPYRDFFLVIPPWYTLKVAALMRIFGTDFFALRAWELGTRTVLGLAVYWWLTRIVRPAYAFLGATLAIIIFSGDSADAITSYHHESVFWAVLAGFALSFVTWRSNTRRDLIFASLAGIGASLAFATKQTTGAGITLTLTVAIALIGVRESGIPGTVARLAAYAAGWSIPAGAIVFWLAKAGGLKAFIDAIFISGPGSKGSLTAVLFRVVLQPLQNPVQAIELLLGVLIAAGLLVLISKRHQDESGGTARPPYGSIILCAAALAIGAALSFADLRPTAASLYPELEFFAIRVGFIGSVALTAYYGIVALRRPLVEAERQKLLLAAVSFATAYMLSLSWPAYQPMACPALGLLIALLLEEMHLTGNASRPARALIVTGTAALLLCAAYLKADLPFSWNGWTDPPVRLATAASARPELKGLHIAPEARDFVDSLTSLIEQHSRPGDPVFLFNYEPLYYVLANRVPPTYAQVHFFDVAPDAICRADAERLRQAMPPVMVDFVTPSAEFDFNEQIFRQGARSGQRDLYETMYEMIRAHYRMEATLQQPGGREVRVFVRNR